MSFGQKLPEPHFHSPVQHRDGKLPWCETCGLTATYQSPGVDFAEVPKAATNEELLKWYPILRYFEYGHLPPNLGMVSSHFFKLAYLLAAMGPDSPETATALRKLLEAKDAAVRSRLDLDNSL